MACFAPRLPELAPWIAAVWVREPGQTPAHARECVLPSGAMHLSLRLDGPPLRLYADAEDRSGWSPGAATVAGARARPYLKASVPCASVGAILRPGATLALFGVSAAELAGRHLALEALCGAQAEALQEWLVASPDARTRAALLEAFLRQRLRPLRGLHPPVAQALAAFEAGALDVAPLVRGSGRSHRHFIACFRQATGLGPKRYARLLRFNRLLRALPATARPSWAALAVDAGYCDQSHLVRDFREFAGVAPSAYRRAAPAHPQHLPLAEDSGQFHPIRRAREDADCDPVRTSGDPP